MAAIDNIPLHQLLQFARSYAKLGSAVTEQLDDLIERGEDASLNINAVKMLRYKLAPLPDPLRDLLDRYLEGNWGEGQGRYASSDAALRGRLVRLAHSRPDLRADILPLLSVKTAAGPDAVGRNWKEKNDGGKHRWVWAGQSGDLAFTVTEHFAPIAGALANGIGEAPLGMYYKMTVVLNDGTMLQTVGQKLDRAEWFKRAAAIYRASQGVMLDFSDMPEKWKRMASDKAARGEGTVMAKFEEGKPADPTENMSPEAAAEWKKQNAINRDQFTKGAGRRTASALRFISDPGHGWLEVPMSELARLGIANQISLYSFRKGRMAYLEEDMDAGTYFEALEAAGEPRPMIREVYQETTPIRNYPLFR